MTGPLSYEVRERKQGMFLQALATSGISKIAAEAVPA